MGPIDTFGFSRWLPYLGLAHESWHTFVGCGSNDSLIFRASPVIFGLLGLCRASGALNLYLRAEEQKGFPQALCLLGRHGSVIPCAWGGFVDWAVVVAVPPPCVPPASLACLGWRGDSAPLWPRGFLWSHPFCCWPWLLWHLGVEEGCFRLW